MGFKSDFDFFSPLSHHNTFKEIRIYGIISKKNLSEELYETDIFCHSNGDRRFVHLHRCYCPIYELFKH